MEIQFKDVNHFKSILINKGLSQLELSKQAGVTQAYLNNVVNGKKTPGLKFCDKICKALNLPFDDLFEVKNEKVIDVDGFSIRAFDGFNLDLFKSKMVIRQYLNLKRVRDEQQHKFEQSKDNMDQMFLYQREDKLSGFILALSCMGLEIIDK